MAGYHLILSLSVLHLNVILGSINITTILQMPDRSAITIRGSQGECVVERSGMLGRVWDQCHLDKYRRRLWDMVAL